jgi:AcrR family transcriptional regulator
MAATAETMDRADRSRRAVLDAAAPIFAERGYTAASLNQIIEASGLTKGGFYFHFPSKLALARAVIADQNERWFEAAMDEANRHELAVDRLFALPKALARLTAQGEGPASLRSMIEELARESDLRDELCGSIRVGVEAVAGQFREAQAEGTIRADLDPDVMAEIAVGGFAGMQALTDQLGDQDFERRVESLIAFVRAATTVRREEGDER